MRLFVAVDPPPGAAGDLDAAIGARDGQLRWVPHAQWHVTLVFCGEVDDARVADLSTRLGRAAARSSPFTLRLAGAGTFPRQSARGRVLWAGLDEDVEPLSRLADRCAAAARRAGVTVEARAFRPHLTLARARGDPVDMSDPVTRLSTYAGAPWPVEAVRLVHSTLGAQVRHETLQEFRLGEGSNG